MRHVLPLALLILSAPLAAAPSVAPMWNVAKSSSKIEFVGAMNGQPFKGVFRRWDASIRFDSKSLATSRVTAAIDTGSAVTGDQTRDEALPGADWFSSKVFPRATFASDQFKDLGNGRYQAIGTLTIRNAKRPVTLPFTLKITGKTAVMQGSLSLDRRLFGVGQGQFATADMVASTVRINILVNARLG